MKKLLFCFVLLISFCFIAHPEYKGDIIAHGFSKLAFAVEYLNYFPTENLNDQTKASNGVSASFEYIILEGLFENIKFGVFGSYSYMHFFPATVELQKLDSHRFIGGLLCRFNLTQDLQIIADTGIGFAMSQLEFMSADNGMIDDVYYDFALECGCGLRKPIVNFKKCRILMDAKINFSFQNEQSEHFFMIGPQFGFIIDFENLR